MVVKIMDAGRTVRNALDYNERKVSQGDAELLEFFSMDAPPPDGLYRTFERYERMNIRTANVSFHMTVNPAEGEELNDEDAMCLCMDLMKSLGYLEQPVAIYKHHDIERVHYHVVSVRTDERGRKIRDFRERVRCQKALAELSPRYGFVIGNGNAEAMKALDIDVGRFHPERGHVVAQMEAIFRECLTYRFTTFEQFRLILREHGLLLGERTADATMMTLQGLDRRGQPCTRAVDEMATGIEMYKDYAARATWCLSHPEGMPRERAARIAAAVLQYSESEEHFLNMLRKKGMYVVLYRHPDTGAVTGSNFVDHRTKTAFKGSELSPWLTVGMLVKASAEQWSPHAGDDAREESEDRSESGGLAAALTQTSGRSMEKDMKDRKKKKNIIPA